VADLLHTDAASEEVHEARESAPWSWPTPETAKDMLGVKAAGFGGQGILMLGELLATMTMESDLHATWLPSYGPEMRGGTANCSVVMSTREIGNPLVDHPDILIAMNRPSLEKFEEEVASGGLVLYDSSLIDITGTREDLVFVPVPATQIANGLGSNKVANAVMLGALSEITGFPEKKTLDGMLNKLGKTEELRIANEKAAEHGREEARKRGAASA